MSPLTDEECREEREDAGEVREGSMAMAWMGSGDVDECVDDLEGGRVEVEAAVEGGVMVSCKAVGERE
jgi:hypothetical protein